MTPQLTVECEFHFQRQGRRKVVNRGPEVPLPEQGRVVGDQAHSPHDGSDEQHDEERPMPVEARPKAAKARLKAAGKLSHRADHLRPVSPRRRQRARLTGQFDRTD